MEKKKKTRKSFSSFSMAANKGNMVKRFLPSPDGSNDEHWPELQHNWSSWVGETGLGDKDRQLQDSPQGWTFQTDNSQCHWALRNSRSLGEAGGGWELNVGRNQQKRQRPNFAEVVLSTVMSMECGPDLISVAQIKTMSADWIIRAFWPIPSLPHFLEGCWKRRRRWIQKTKNSSELQVYF